VRLCGAQQKVGHLGASPTYKSPGPGTVHDVAAGHKPAPENTVESSLHCSEKARDLGRVMAKPGIDLQNPVGSGSQSFAIAPKVGVNDTAALGGPHNVQSWFGRGEATHQLQAVVDGHAVKDGEENDLPEAGAALEHSAREANRRLSLIGHR